ncbi:MAG: bacterioferritin [Kangiellaceae bacterium]|jgi:bacterioferritin|nr:bacterioferritin [Kangiellaceae bacterium]
MKGNAKINEALNKLLSLELTAMDQYFIHAQMYQDWGLNKLYERISHEFDDEKMHATLLIDRMLFLEGIPDMVTREPLRIGKNVKSMLENDLKVEEEVGQLLKDTIVLCEQEKDFQTRTILQKLLEDTEEDHAHWLEQQIRLIDMVGAENYQQSQM